MKILMAARRYPPDVWSGTETVFQALYERARARHEVRLVVGWRRERELVPPEAVAVPLRDRGKAGAWLAMSRAVRAEARRFRPDVVLSNSIEVPPTGVPTACIVHDLNFGQSSRDLEATLKSGFYGLRSRSLGAVITVSEASAGALRAAGVPEARLEVIANGVDTEHFRPPEVPRDGSREPVRFVYASRILPGKGQHHAIDAIARLPRLHKRRAHLTIAGAVSDRVFLDQLQVQAYAQPVDFALDLPELVSTLQGADVALFPTVMEEGFGFTAVEAMATGLPVIWFDQPAIREATGGHGIPVPREDIDALRAAMMRLMDNPEERLALGREGLAWVRENLDWDKVWDRYEAVLTRLAGQGRGSASGAP